MNKMTKHCDDCNRDIDVRGWPMHNMKHQREKGLIPHLVRRPNHEQEDPVVRAFEIGYQLGKKAA